MPEVVYIQKTKELLRIKRDGNLILISLKLNPCCLPRGLFKKIWRVMQILLAAIFIGFLNAFRGSGWLQSKGYVLAADILKWAIIPLALFCGAVYFKASEVQALILTLPYYWFMATGTGGAMQAYIYQTINSTKGWPPFVNICTKLANQILYKNQTPPDPLPNEWYRLWGFIYATLVGIIFSLPFLVTDYLYGIPILFFGFTCRYLIWRANEFILLAFQSGLFFLSLQI
jgi:hypothetical protein